MALAAGVSSRLPPTGPRATGRQGRSRGFSSGCARPDRTKEAAEAEAGVAPCGPAEGDGGMVNGEGGRAATPLTPGAAELGRGPHRPGGLGPSDSGRTATRRAAARGCSEAQRGPARGTRAPAPGEDRGAWERAGGRPPPAGPGPRTRAAG